MAHILLIDDNPQIVETLKKILEREGHTVAPAQNGKEGLDLLATTRYDVIVTDLIMPECDGFELIMAIRNMPQRPKIIAISGGSSHCDQEKLLRMAKWISADAVLSKPLQLPQLCDIVRKVLNAP